MKKINTNMVKLTHALILSSLPVASASDFNTSVIESITGEVVDTSNFMGTNGVAEGQYLVDIKINNKNSAQQELIQFKKELMKLCHVLAQFYWKNMGLIPNTSMTKPLMLMGFV